MSSQMRFSKNLERELVIFFERVPPERLCRNLRGLLMGMLAAQKDGYCFDLDDLLADMIGLFELLDAAGDELTTSK